jgi:CRP-like cAMP-binding protein
MSSESSAHHQPQCFPAGLVLIRQGDRSDSAWLIVSGELEVLLDGDGCQRRLAVVGPGSLVGEMALIDDGVRTATVRTLSPVKATHIGRSAFRRMIDACPPLTGYLLRSMIATIRRTHGLPQDEADVSGDAIVSTRMSDAVLDRRLFRGGAVFFRQGDRAGNAFLIQSGRVSIRHEVAGWEAGIELAVLGPGRLFGELAILADRPRAATAVALEPTTCEVLRPADFTRLTSAMPPLLRTLTRIYTRQLTTLAETAAAVEAAAVDAAAVDAAATAAAAAGDGTTIPVTTLPLDVSDWRWTTS